LDLLRKAVSPTCWGEAKSSIKSSIIKSIT
jgi:hypothetical protein